MPSNDWSALPSELLETIVRKLLVYADYIRFRAVCKAWRTSILRFPTHFPCQFPWLMCSESGYNSYHRAFVNIPDNKIHYLYLPEASYPSRRCGSSHGWLAIMDESPRIFLINPLTRAEINLPPISTFPNVVSFDFSNIGCEYVLRTIQQNQYYSVSLQNMRDDFIKKIVLSNSPSSQSHFVALAIIRRQSKLQLACCKSNQNSWRLVQHHGEDVTFFNGLIYSVDKRGVMAVIDFSGDSPVLVEIIGKPILNSSRVGNIWYLVNAMGELLLVSRLRLFEIGIEYLMCKTFQFKVFRFNFDGMNWEELTNLGDKVLFLGESSSLALCAADYPGCRGNRIYFTDDLSKEDGEDLHGDHDSGIFNLEDSTIEPLHCYFEDFCGPLPWPPPIWVTPNPCS